MANLEISKLQDNEMARTDDLMAQFKRSITNLKKYADFVVKSGKNYIIGGNVTASGTNIVVAPFFGSCTGAENEEEKNFINTDSTTIAIPDWATGLTRRDIVEVKGQLADDGGQARRGFINFGDSTVTYSNVYIKQSVKTNIVIKTGSSTACPDVSDGSIKLAEVHINNGVITVYPVSSDLEDVANTGWTKDTTSIFKIYGISDIFTKLRNVHNNDGSLKNGIVDLNKLNTADGASHVNASGLKLGAAIGSYPASTTIYSAIQTALNQESSLETKFNVIHNSDGTLKSSIVDLEKLNTSDGSSHVNASGLTLGAAMGSQAASTTIFNAIKSVTDKESALETRYNVLHDTTGNFKDDVVDIDAIDLDSVHGNSLNIGSAIGSYGATTSIYQMLFDLYKRGYTDIITNVTEYNALVTKSKSSSTTDNSIRALLLSLNATITDAKYLNLNKIALLEGMGTNSLLLIGSFNTGKTEGSSPVYSICAALYGDNASTTIKNLNITVSFSAPSSSTSACIFSVICGVGTDQDNINGKIENVNAVVSSIPSSGLMILRAFWECHNIQKSSVKSPGNSGGLYRQFNFYQCENIQNCNSNIINSSASSTEACACYNSCKRMFNNIGKSNSSGTGFGSCYADNGSTAVSASFSGGVNIFEQTS